MDTDSIARAIQALDVDIPFTVAEDGTVAHAPGWYPPAVYWQDGIAAVESDAWRFVPAGRGGDYVHEPNEYVAAIIAEWLTDTHDAGTVFALVSVDDLDDDTPVGWAIVAAVESFPGYVSVCGACACLIANDDTSGDDAPGRREDGGEWRRQRLATFLADRCPPDAVTDITVTPVGLDGSPDDWPEDAGQTRTDRACDVCGEPDDSISPTLHDALTRTRRT